MKKLSFFCLSLLLLFSLSACGASTQADSLALQYKDTGTKLSLGMTKEEVEKALTSNEIVYIPAEAPTEPSGNWSATYGAGEDQLTVWYSNGETTVVTHLEVDSTDKNHDSNWKLDGSISLTSSRDDIEKVYGPCSLERDTYFAYHYDINGDEPFGDAILAFQLDTAGQIDYFYIATLP